MDKEKTIPFDDKYADGFCASRDRKIIRINPIKDKDGGFDKPYVNCLDGGTVVILPGDRIVVKGKKVVRVIKKNV